MDPNATLTEMETLLTRLGGSIDDGCADGATDRLHELSGALRMWLLRGGFEPDWSKAPQAAELFGREVQA